MTHKPIYFYNTLTKQKEEFKPLQSNEVRMYNCGPTVYDYVHIGNLRAYVFADILRRTLEWNGYEVEQVINITDVGHLSGENAGNVDTGEDKMTKALKRLGKEMTLANMAEVGNMYTEKFVENIEALNINKPTHMPKASDHIAEDIEIVRGLEEKGLAYTTTDGVYFDTSKINYGKLGGLSENREARISDNQEKRNPKDFSLWKFNNELGWDSPWGKGFPGWHIECSAMSMKYLGETFDIHTGGMDHIPIHHNNEIAQSESYTGKPYARFWLHNAFVTINEGKMAKSEGTGLTLNNLKEKGFSPLAYRYWLLGAHYRSPIDFSWEALQGAENAYQRLLGRLGEIRGEGEVISEYKEKFEQKINDDLNTPGAVAAMWDMLKNEDLSKADKKATVLEFDKVLGLGLDELSPAEIPEEIQNLTSEREEARKNRNFDRADELRKEIGEKGYRVKDTSEGPRILRN